MNKHLVALLALAADLTATLFLWPRLPERIPVHWNLLGEVDRYGSRWEVLALGPGLLLGLWLVLSLIGRIDPKAAVPLPADAPAAETGTRDAVVALVLAMLALFHISVLLQAAGIAVIGATHFALLLAGFQLALGNFLPRLRPNFFIGIRTPWTLSSDAIWRRAHRLGGRLLFVSGFASAAAVAILPVRPGLLVALGLLGAALLAPAVASYVWWRGQRKASSEPPV